MSESLRGSADVSEVPRSIHVALLCVQHQAEHRQTMLALNPLEMLVGIVSKEIRLGRIGSTGSITSQVVADLPRGNIYSQRVSTSRSTEIIIHPTKIHRFFFVSSDTSLDKKIF
ncbi:hypothetical protein Tco_1055689 [Tanacetum coccineum]|uniref:Uncharacterized protein n=1 Tax=Tanacetum coccineum TaxID=301880 RepID=A0ABQ5H0E9_9ASTR